MNDKKVTVDAGDHRRILKRTVVKLAKPGASSSHLLLIQLSAESQALTFEKFSLAGHRELEDGSDRNATMIVALGKIRLRTLKNLGDESEWHAGFPHLISLSKGQTMWQAPGMYHIENTRPDPADFLMIEW